MTPAYYFFLTLAFATVFTKDGKDNNELWLNDNLGELPIRQLVRNCLLLANDSVTFDILIDIAQNPQANEHNRRAQYKTAYGRILGKYFGPIFSDYIKQFVASVQRDMDKYKLYSVILDGSTKYYLSESSVVFDITISTTTTEKPNEFVSFFRKIGAAIQRFFHDSDGSAVTGSEADEFDPSGSQLSKITSLTLKARASGLPIRLPNSKPNGFVTPFTIVITDGAQVTPSYYYPDSAIILDIGGGWASTGAARSYLTTNVLTVDKPQDLIGFVDIIRYMMCQSIGGITGTTMLF